MIKRIAIIVVFIVLLCSCSDHSAEDSITDPASPTDTVIEDGSEVELDNSWPLPSGKEAALSFLSDIRGSIESKISEFNGDHGYPTETVNINDSELGIRLESVKDSSSWTKAYTFTNTELVADEQGFVINGSYTYYAVNNGSQYLLSSEAIDGKVVRNQDGRTAQYTYSFKNDGEVKEEWNGVVFILRE